MLPTLIYINGPKGCGKTTLAEALCSYSAGVCQVQFPTPLWEIADGILHQLGRMNDTEEPLDFTSQDIKASVISPGGTVTWRSFLVEQANVLRKYFGPTVLGDIASRSAKSLLLQGMDTVVFPNVRTDEDLIPLVPLVGRRQQILIRIERNGCDWSNDNGHYIAPKGLVSITLSNNTTPAELIMSALNFLEEDPSDADART